MNTRTKRKLTAFAKRNDFPLTRIPVDASEATSGDVIKSGYAADIVDNKTAYFRLELEHEDSDADELMKIAIISIEQSAAEIKKYVLFLAAVVATGLAVGLLATLSMFM